MCSNESNLGLEQAHNLRAVSHFCASDIQNNNNKTNKQNYGFIYRRFVSSNANLCKRFPNC